VGGALQEGTLKQTRGPGLAALGEPPSGRTLDWVVLVKLPPGVRVDASLAEVEAAPAPRAPRGEAGAVVSFTLINADTDQPIGPLADGATLDLAKLPTRNLNVRADTKPAAVGSVRFALDGRTKTEATAPYALAGDRDGDYAAWTPSPGAHTLTATPFSVDGAQGKALTVRFRVTAP
jgi:hypothetical protein